MSNNRRSLLAALCVALCALPTSASADKAAGRPRWAGAGPGAVKVLDGRAGMPELHYTLDGDAAWAPQRWELATHAERSGAHKLRFTYTGDHAFSEVRVHLAAFIERDGKVIDVPIVAEGPVRCCAAPSGGFRYAGVIVLHLRAGDRFGFRLGGENYDDESVLTGTLTVDPSGVPGAGGESDMEPRDLHGGDKAPLDDKAGKADRPADAPASPPTALGDDEARSAGEDAGGGDGLGEDEDEEEDELA